MKKSYDYFKTLKDMSYCVKDSYTFAVSSKDFKKEVIRFSGIKTELSESLMNEFVAPIERNDIYKLSFCLNEELWQVTNLYDFIRLADISSFGFIGQIGDLFNKQNDIFSLLGDFKSTDRTMKLISESFVLCNRTKKQILNEVKSALQSAKQPLLKYSVSCAFSELVIAVEKTFCEVERVIINNS